MYNAESALEPVGNSNSVQLLHRSTGLYPLTPSVSMQQ